MASKLEIQEALLELIAPKKKAAKKEPKYVIVVNGVVASQRPTNKKDLEAATIAIKIKNPSAKILAYKLQGELTIDFPVAGINEEEA
jgi:hypothetical protein